MTAFTGRRAQLAELDRALAESTSHATATTILVISGTAGVGKTALTVHWAHRVAKAFPDGQLYLNLRGYDPDRPLPAAEALERFLRALGVEGPAIPYGLDERAAQFRTLLADRKMLVLLDNVHSVDQVRELLPGAPSCLVLITSRDTLPALVARHGAVRINLDVLSPGEAIELLRRLVGARLDEEPEQARGLARRCARLPLALRIAAELATARGSVPLSRLVTELGDESRRLDLLAAGGDDHTAVRAVFSWSCRHLSDAAVTVFELLGLHPGRDIDVDAAAALVDMDPAEARRLLEVLARAHLVAEHGPGRFGMHDLLRAYAAERAVPRADRHPALIRLFDHYVRTAARAVEQGPDSPWPGDQWLGAERSNLLAVAAAAVDVSPEHAVRLSACLARHLDTAALYRDGLTLHRLALTAARARHDPAGEAGSLNRLGTAYLRIGSYQESIDHYRQALAVHRENGNLEGEGAARHGLGTVILRLGRCTEARDQLEAALTIRRTLGDRPGEGAALYALGNVHRQLGDYQKALDHHRRALVIYRECGERIGESRALNNLGTTLERMGDYLQALDHYERALALNRAVGNHLGEAVALTNVGWAAARLGRFDEAIVHHERALPLYVESGYRLGQADALHGLGHVYRRTGSHGEAMECLGQAVALAHEIGVADVETGALFDLGEAQRAAGDREAAATYRSGLALAEHTGDRYEQARALTGMAQLDHRNGELAEARQRWRTAAAIFDELGVPEAAEVHRLLAALDESYEPDEPDEPDEVAAAGG